MRGSKPVHKDTLSMPIRVKTRGNETAEQMLRRFKKLCEREGITKDVKKRQYYEKPSEIRRRESMRLPQKLFAIRAEAAAAAVRGGGGGARGKSATGSRTGGPRGNRSGGRSSGPRSGGPRS
jgi:small subunit ribosomal protein S21